MLTWIALTSRGFTNMRQAYHIARADFLQRARSRRLVAVLAVVAYFGYLVNVGGIEIAYQIDRADGLTAIHGTNTAPFVGLKTGLTGAAVLLFGGFYLMNATITRDRRNDVGRLVASTTVSNWTYLFGKWLSNLALAIVMTVALGVAAVINHLVHGVGPTDLLAVVGPLVLFALPVGAVVGAVALLFETIDWLNGTGGNVGYIFLLVFVLAGLTAADGKLPDAVPLWVYFIDVMGQLAVYELTVNGIQATVSGYSGGPPSFGTLRASESFVYTGRPWPWWIFLQRAWLVVPAIVMLSAATVPFDRLGSTDTIDAGGWIARLRGRILTVWSSSESTTAVTDSRPVESMTFTTVERRDRGSFLRLVAAETRLTVRGRRWWWYAIAATLVGVPLLSVVPIGESVVPSELARRLLLPLVFIWPMFLWSELGVRATRNQMTETIVTSQYPVKQVLAEWLSGVVLAVGVASGAVILFVTTGQLGGLLGVASGIVFAPALAIALGTWSRSPTVFELTYLLLWYVGPLNGGSPVDFVGATAESTAIGAPYAFIVLSLVLVGTAVFRRKFTLGD